MNQATAPRRADPVIRNEDIPFPRQRTVPVWPDSIPALDQRAAAWTLFALGDADPEVLAAWEAVLTERGAQYDVARVLPADLDAWLAALPAWFPALAATKYTGWRVAVTGEEFAVLALRLAATRAGLLSSERVEHVTRVDRALVYCPHCTGKTMTPDRSTNVVVCAHCARELVIRSHYSTGHGAYLGVIAVARKGEREVLQSGDPITGQPGDE